MTTNKLHSATARILEESRGNKPTPDGSWMCTRCKKMVGKYDYYGRCEDCQNDISHLSPEPTALVLEREVDALRSELAAAKAERDSAKQMMQGLILDPTLPEHLRANAHKVLTALLVVAKERDKARDLIGLYTTWAEQSESLVRQYAEANEADANGLLHELHESVWMGLAAIYDSPDFKALKIVKHDREEVSRLTAGLAATNARADAAEKELKRRDDMEAKDCRRSVVPRWMPIETAPKDGTRVLVLRGSTQEAYWSDDHMIPLGKTGDFSWGGDGWCWPDFSPQPTHWMPLPLAPEDAT